MRFYTLQFSQIFSFSSSFHIYAVLACTMTRQKQDVTIAAVPFCILWRPVLKRTRFRFLGPIVAGEILRIFWSEYDITLIINLHKLISRSYTVKAWENVCWMHRPRSNMNIQIYHPALCIMPIYNVDCSLIQRMRTSKCAHNWMKSAHSFGVQSMELARLY